MSAPTVEAIIASVMRKHPRETSTEYYVAVHQELAPLARSFEAALRRIAADHPALADSYGLAEIFATPQEPK